MTALAADTPRVFPIGLDHNEPLELDVVKVFGGSTLEWDTTNGGVSAYAGGTGKFAGFAKEGGDNVGGALGDIVIDVARKGIVVLVLSATVGLGNVGDTVYAATDDDTFNLTLSGNMAIGKISRVVTAGTSGNNEVEVAYEAVGFSSV